MLSSCTQQFESLNNNNQEQLKDQIKLETKPDGSGDALTSTSIYLNQEVTFYPVKRDDKGDYVENISVSWSVEGGVGTLTIDPSGKNATFTGTTPGTATVKIFIDDILFSSTDVSVTASALELSNLQISNVTTTSFDVSVDYSGDVEENSSVSFFYCNETQAAGCDPLSGTEIALVRGDSSWTNSVTSLSVGETFNVAINAEDSEGVTGLPLSTQQQLTGTAITISNLVISNITVSSFDASIDFTGDNESSSAVTLSYCNRTNNASCDPSSSGDSIAMVRSGSQYTVSVTGLTSPSFDAGDTIALEVVAVDPDGVTGSPLATTDYLGDIQLSNFNVSSERKSGFYAKVDFTERNSNATVMLYYCNETDSPGCNPQDGDFQPMTRNGNIFETTVSGLTTPYDEGDQVKAQAVASDPEGAYNPSGLNESFRLADIILYEMRVGMIDQDSFAIKIYKNETNGDDNGNGSAIAYYCNNTTTPGCDPKTGVSTAISNFNSCSSIYCNYEQSFTNISATANPGESINFLVEFTDPDGIWKEGTGGGSPSSYSLTINIPNPTPIYRSVGPGQTTALIDGRLGAGTFLTLTSGSASFSSALLDEVGVGDAIFYDSNNDSTIDALAFIHQRTDNQNYTLKDKDGNTPIDAVSHSNWRLYRAYTSAANAENGIENSGISADSDLPAGLKNFDSWTDGKDISAQTGSDQHWYVALYAGNQADTDPLYISGEWVKDWIHDLEFFVPYKSEHVGVSQKHNGVWDNNKYRLEVTDATAVNMSYLRRINIKGLQIEIKGSTNQINGIYTRNNSQGVISSNIIKSSSTGTNLKGIQVYTYGGVSTDGKYYDYDYSWSTFANNIIYNFNTTDSKGFYVAYQGSNGDGQRLFNNTFYNNYYGVYINTGYQGAHIRNNIAINSFNEDFETTRSNGNISVKTNNISSDSTGNTTLVSATDLFLDPANDDFRLKAGAASAIDQGYDVSGLITDDIQGEIRSLPFDIGADEL